MLESARDLDLAGEPLHDLVVVLELAVHDLEGHAAPELDVAGAEDGPHAALGDQRVEPVALVDDPPDPTLVLARRLVLLVERLGLERRLRPDGPDPQDRSVVSALGSHLVDP